MEMGSAKEGERRRLEEKLTIGVLKEPVGIAGGVR
jgi:hypothetical protein